MMCVMIVYCSAAVESVSNDGIDISSDMLQRMKKHCAPARAKSFKERNPDLDLDEIQQNPNIPDDIKAVLIESALVLDQDDVLSSTNNCIGNGATGHARNESALAGNCGGGYEILSPVEFKSKKELLAYIDDGTGTIIIGFYYQSSSSSSPSSNN